MKSLETEKDTIEKICDILTVGTLEPAKKQAAEIILEAEKKAHEIVEKARAESAALVKDAENEIAQKESIFHSTMAQASAQSLEAIRQKIQKELFSTELTELLNKELVKPQVVADLIRSIVKAVDSQGLSLDLQAFIPSVSSADEINKLLGHEVLNKLQNKSVVLSQLPGGVAVKLKDKELTIDISSDAVKEVVSSYIRKDLREMIFGTGKS